MRDTGSEAVPRFPTSGRSHARQVLRRLQEHPATRALARLVPAAAGLAVAKALFDYLPQPLGPTLSRYLVTAAGGVAVMTSLGWVRLWHRQRSPRTSGEAAIGTITPAGSSTSIHNLFGATREALVASMVTAGEGADRLIGWHHYLDDDPRVVRPTAIGTCYGLKSMMLLDMLDPRLQQHRLVETLWRLQEPSGGVQDSSTGLWCWSERLAGTGRRERVVPSVPHTARAVIALQRVGQDHRAVEPEIEEAIRWLVGRGDLTNQTEQIRRQLPEHLMESLVVKHFTAAWVARALMTVERDNPEWDRLLRTAVQRVCDLQTDGVWEWDNRERPIWMTYQGIATLKQHALRTSGLPR